MSYLKAIEDEIEEKKSNELKKQTLKADPVYLFASRELNNRKFISRWWNVSRIIMCTYYVLFLVLLPIYLEISGVDELGEIYFISKISGSLFTYDLSWYYEIILFFVLVFLVISISDKIFYGFYSLYLSDSVEYHLKKLDQNKVYVNFNGSVPYSKKLNTKLKFKKLSKIYRILESTDSWRETNLIYYPFLYNENELFTTLINRYKKKNRTIKIIKFIYFAILFGFVLGIVIPNIYLYIDDFNTEVNLYDCLASLNWYYTIPTYAFILLIFLFLFEPISFSFSLYDEKEALKEFIHQHPIFVLSNESSETVRKADNETESIINKLKSKISFFSGNVKNKSDIKKHNLQYDIALSFAGEDRKYAEAIAENLKKKNIKVFYDKYEQDSLWGKNLYQHLQTVYRDSAKYCVIIISSNYANKLWTKHELEQAQARAFIENSEYILPLRLDNTELPGLNETIGYIDLNEFSIDQVSNLLLKKIIHE